MTEQLYTTSIHNLGFISAAKNYTCCKKQKEKEATTEDYVGKITAAFLPYLKQNITDGKIISLQNEIKKIVCEIRESRI